MSPRVTMIDHKPVEGDAVRCIGGPYDARRIRWLGGDSMYVRPLMSIDDAPGIPDAIVEPAPIQVAPPVEYTIRTICSPRRRFYYAAPVGWTDDRCIARMLGESEDGL